MHALARDQARSAVQAARQVGLLPPTAAPEPGAGLGHRHRHRIPTLTVHVDDPTAARVTATTGLPPEALRAMTLERYAGTVLDLDRAHWWRGAGRLSEWIDHTAVSVCPPCLATAADRWPLAWLLPWSFLCLDHRVYLVGQCPRCAAPLTPAGVAAGACTGRPSRASNRTKLKPPCCADLTNLPTTPVRSYRTVQLQRALLTAADAPADQRPAARERFGDLWVAACAAMFTADPRDLHGADDPVRDAFATFPDTVRAGTHRKHQPPLIRAALALAADTILSAPDPFDAVVVMAQRNQRPEWSLQLAAAWRPGALRPAAGRGGLRVQKILQAAHPGVVGGRALLIAPGARPETQAERRARQATGEPDT
ncbi:hypothetical protein GCM10009760_19730 [Kitasatospora kazusensis]|uniref:TniQ domain-containing protein n=1 Tax=Kitasatospora kazusensis TaxID=407974 RepID=A0ABN2Z8H4_9ACTN